MERKSIKTYDSSDSLTVTVDHSQKDVTVWYVYASSRFFVNTLSRVKIFI